MAKLKIEVLIQRLSSDTKPVRILRAPWMRTLFWLAISAPAVAATLLMTGGEIRGAIYGPRFFIAQAATLAMSISAALAAFSLTIPGSSRNLVWPPLVLLGVLLLIEPSAGVTNWRHADWQAFQIRADWAHLMIWLSANLISLVVTVFMLRRGAPLAPRAAVAFGMLAGASLSSLELRYFNANDAFFIDIVWPMPAAFILMALGGLIGPFLLTWRHLKKT